MSAGWSTDGLRTMSISVSRAAAQSRQLATSCTPGPLAIQDYAIDPFPVGFKSSR
jgi:hypothetical protein